MLRSTLIAALLFASACGSSAPEEPSDSDTTPDVPEWITDSPQDRLLASMTFPGHEVELVQGEPPAPNGATFVISGLDGAPDLMSIGPGQPFEIAFAYDEVFVNPIDVIIYFDGGSGYFRVRVDLVEGKGQVRIPAEMRDDVCDNLAEIIHSIQCNEALQGAGNVANYLIMNLELRCDGSAGPTDTDPPETSEPTTDTGKPKDTGETAPATLPEADFLLSYADLFCGMESTCDPKFYQKYPDGIYHCQNAVKWEVEGCTYDEVQGALCIDELGAAAICDDYAGPWRDTCALVWSACP